MVAPKLLRVATVSAKYIIELQPDANGTRRLEGLEGQFLAMVLAALGMDYKIVIPGDLEFGNLKENGSFSGIIGMLSRNEADIGLGLLKMSEERALAVDFSRNYNAAGLTFAVAKPLSFTPIFAGVYPFDVATWFGICATIIGSSVFSYVIGGGWCFYNLLSSVLKQPMKMGNYSLKWRLFVGSWLLFTLVVTSCYASALLSFLTLPFSSDSIDNFQELSLAVQRGTHRCFALKGSFQIPSLKTSKTQNIQILGKLIENNKWFYNTSEVGNYSRYIGARSVLIEGQTPIKLFLGLRKDKYQVSEDVLMVSPIALALNKKFCCKKRLNSIISRIDCSGIYGKLLRDVSLKLALASLKSVKVKEEEAVKPLTVKDISGCLVILIVGWVLSSTLLIGEIVLFYLHENSN